MVLRPCRERGLTDVVACVGFTRTGGSVRTFHYEFSNAYFEVQEAFKHTVATYDPNNVARLLQRHPYHVDSMLQMSEFYRSTNQLDEAAGMLRRYAQRGQLPFHYRVVSYRAPYFPPMTATGACSPLRARSTPCSRRGKATAACRTV